MKLTRAEFYAEVRAFQAQQERRAEVGRKRAKAKAKAAKAASVLTARERAIRAAAGAVS